jgi:hypothetical protein
MQYANNLWSVTNHKVLLILSLLFVFALPAAVSAAPTPTLYSGGAIANTPSEIVEILIELNMIPANKAAEARALLVEKKPTTPVVDNTAQVNPNTVRSSSLIKSDTGSTIVFNIVPGQSAQETIRFVSYCQAIHGYFNMANSNCENIKGR